MILVTKLRTMSKSEEERYEEAKRRVAEEKSFYTHLLTFMVIIPFLVLVNYFTSRGYWWVKWPILGWGLGLFMHGMRTFGGLYGKDWEDKRIKKYMDKD